MDRPLPRRRRSYVSVAVGMLLLSGAIATLSALLPRGLRVAASDIRTATVERGMFHNDMTVRSTAAPLHTVMLDALESGRVEQILAGDGSLVAQGELLFRLSNPQLRLNLVAREAERAQQIANLANLRVAIETSRTEHQRRMLDLGYELAQARKQQARYRAIRQYVAAATLEEAADRVAKLQRSVDDSSARFAIEMRVKRDGMEQMEQAVERLDAGLKVVNGSLEGLDVRAPIAGRLTDFVLQLGEIVKLDQHVGRIDDPSQVKLMAQVDEFYLGNVSVGKTGTVRVNGRDYAVEVRRVLPQVKDGRFTVEMSFAHESPDGLSPGQSIETRLSLGEAIAGLILPNDAFLNDSGGTWVFVLDRVGSTAGRRTIRVGRRNDSQVEVASGLAPGDRVIVSSYAGFGKAERLQLIQ